jgi:hypothetical protein
VKAKYSAKFVIVLLNTLSLCRTCSWWYVGNSLIQNILPQLV